MKCQLVKFTLILASLANLRIAAILTAFLAASSKSYVNIILNPDSSINFLASSIFVPFILNTIGFFIPNTVNPLSNPKTI